jgi:hypothetical protein
MVLELGFYDVHNVHMLLMWVENIERNLQRMSKVVSENLSLGQKSRAQRRVWSEEIAEKRGGLWPCVGDISDAHRQQAGKIDVKLSKVHI